MGYHSRQSNDIMPLIRPKLLVDTAHIGARSYERGRDLPGALTGAAGRLATSASPIARGAIMTGLTEAELRCEEMRRGNSPAYRPGRHVQVLSALLAEAGRDCAQTKASGSDALRRAM